MTTTILPIWDDRRGVVSLTHDDGGPGQWDHGLKVLHANGLVGTIFLIRNSVHSWSSDVLSASSRKMHVPQMLCARDMGHEIASHTYSHDYRLDTLDQAGIIAECLGNKNYFTSWGVPCESIAYPGGDTNQLVLDTMPACGMRYGRTVGTPTLHTMDFADLDKYNVPTTSSGVSQEIVEQAIAERKWCIKVFHIISDASSTTPAAYAAFAEWLATKVASKDLWVGTFSQVMRYMEQRHTATVIESNPTADRLRVTVTVTGDNAFMVPMTLKTDVSGRGELLAVTQSGMDIPYRIEGDFAIYDVYPNAGGADAVFFS